DPAIRVTRNGFLSAGPAPAASISTDRVNQVLVEVVADKTGYPPEMLEMDMALDTDLGIDSIKRVEILSALQERLPDAPTVKPEQLGTLHTLRQVAEFLARAPSEVVANGQATPTATSQENGETRILRDGTSTLSGGSDISVCSARHQCPAHQHTLQRLVVTKSPFAPAGEREPISFSSWSGV